MRLSRSVLTASALAALSVGATTALASPASAAPNTTPQKVCGSGYKTVNSAAVGSLGTVYLTYNATNGKNCVATIRTNPGTAVDMYVVREGQPERLHFVLTREDVQLKNVTYSGFVEGHDIGKGTVDVVVTEGFTGNIALKTAEGTARQVGTWMREAFKADVISKLGAFVAGQAIAALKRKLDPRNINGGVFLGLNGIVIKSHAGTDAVGFKAAVGLAYEMARSRLMDKIGEGMRQFPTLEMEAVAPTPEPEKKPA